MRYHGILTIPYQDSYNEPHARTVNESSELGIHHAVSYSPAWTSALADRTSFSS